MDYLLEINDPAYNAIHNKSFAALAPLPARSPHLNGIGSVFRGMSGSVIRNSDYDSVAECRDVIDKYFEKRNQYYVDNHSYAGNKIWAKEKVKPVFNKANICRNIG